jgi:hypothetical protein
MRGAPTTNPLPHEAAARTSAAASFHPLELGWTATTHTLAEVAPIDDDPDHVWVFTFGFGHHDPQSGAPLSNCYTCVRGTFEAARRAMVDRYDNRWAFQYVDREAAGVDRHGLREVPFL